jgi:hypothetical protein
LPLPILPAFWQTVCFPLRQSLRFSQNHCDERRAQLPPRQTCADSGRAVFFIFLLRLSTDIKQRQFISTLAPRRHRVVHDDLNEFKELAIDQAPAGHPAIGPNLASL